MTQLREGLVGCLAVAAREAVELDADISEPEPLLLAACWTTFVLGLLTQHLQLGFQIPGPRHRGRLLYPRGALAAGG